MAGERMATLSFLTKEEEEGKVGGGKILLIVVKNRVTYGASHFSLFIRLLLFSSSSMHLDPSSQGEGVTKGGGEKKGGPSTG